MAVFSRGSGSPAATVRETVKVQSSAVSRTSQPAPAAAAERSPRSVSTADARTSGGASGDEVLVTVNEYVTGSVAFESASPVTDSVNDGWNRFVACDAVSVKVVASPGPCMSV